uniref:CCHC-type domain-containing protein n=1 Tax=Tanacetum cinerariifolium TaxID=118510 RepID=A0A6L2JMX6_TANCI|nr:hypothetical protein [Tanacetum cinerariifolium]
MKNTIVTTLVNVTGAPVTNTIANHAKKPEKFNGQNFKRWQHKMFFYLTTLNLVRFLKETAPQAVPPKEGQPSNAQAVQAVEEWKHLEFLCHNYILNGLVDSLCNMYYKTMTAKELWESLERKYKTEDVGIKKFATARFLDYKMVDSKNVITQKKTYTPNFAKANMVEHAGSSSKSNSKAKGKGKGKNDKKRKGKVGYLALKVRVVKQMLQGTCYNCDQPDHRAANCKMPKRVTLRQANMNLVSSWLLKEFGFCLVFKSDKFVLFKNQMYVGMGYVVKDKRQQYDNDLQDESQDQPKEEEVEPRRSKKARTDKSSGLDFVSFMIENEPTSYQEAVNSSKGPRWKYAIKREIDSILQNHTWEFMNLPPGCKPLGYKWIFKKKMKADGTIDNNDKMIKSIKDMLKSKFDMKDLGSADVILEIKIIQTHNGLVLSQAHYLDKILNTHNAGDFGLARTLPTTLCIYLNLEA